MSLYVAYAVRLRTFQSQMNWRRLCGAPGTLVVGVFGNVAAGSSGMRVRMLRVAVNVCSWFAQGRDMCSGQQMSSHGPPTTISTRRTFDVPVSCSQFRDLAEQLNHLLSSTFKFNATTYVSGGQGLPLHPMKDQGALLVALKPWRQTICW
jgi:hypothetical protein